ncbi:MAG TPA: hypothetical protein VIG85_04485, partial [Comamonas sp.]
MHDIVASPLHQRPSFLHGTQPLWKAFWLVYVGGHVLLSMGQAKVLLEVLPRLQMTGMGSQQMIELLSTSITALFVIVLLYFVWCAVVVWRCAARHSNALWCWSARAVLMLHGV